MSIKYTKSELKNKDELIISNNISFNNYKLYLDRCNNNYHWKLKNIDNNNILEFPSDNNIDCLLFECDNINKRFDISLDNNFIAFIAKKANENYSTYTNIYLYNILDNSCEFLYFNSHGFIMDPSFSPNNNFLGYLCEQTDGIWNSKRDIIIYNIEKNININLTENIELSCTSFMWYNDKIIVFTAEQYGTSNLFAINIFTKKYYQITNINENNNCGYVIEYNNGYTIYKNSFYGEPVKCKLEYSDKKLSVIYDKIDEYLFKKNEESKSYILKQHIYKCNTGEISLYWIAIPKVKNSNSTILWCLGGPHYAWSPSIMIDTRKQELEDYCKNGYYVIMPIVHGMPGISLDFDNEIRGDWCGKCIEDYMIALKDAYNKYNFNINSVIASGHSYGGACVYYLAGKYSKFFKGFIAESGIYNFKQLSEYNEKNNLIDKWNYLAEFEGGYKNDEKYIYLNNMYIHSPHNFINNWEKPILIIHGKYDKSIPIEQIYEAINNMPDKCKKISPKPIIFNDEGHVYYEEKNIKIRNNAVIDFINTI